MLHRFTLVAFFAMVAIPVLKADAEIIMTIDTSAQTFSFFGSDTGSPQDDGDTGSIIWECLHNIIPGSPVADTTFKGFSPDSHWDFNNSIQIINDPDFETRLSISLISTVGPFGSITVTPNTTVYDYSFFSSEQVTILTNLLRDGSIPVGFFSSGSSGFSAITVTSVAPVLGDVNCDGVVNLLDVNPFIAALSSGQYNEKADTNQDGVVNLLDVEPFIAILSGN